MRLLKKQIRTERPEREKVGRKQALKRVKAFPKRKEKLIALSEKARIEIFIPNLPDPVMAACWRNWATNSVMPSVAVR